MPKWELSMIDRILKIKIWIGGLLIVLQEGEDMS
jgi:hypothetical protein